MCPKQPALRWGLLPMLPLLLCATRGARSLGEGEWCRAWPSRTEPPAVAFRCPSDAPFCCGTCHFSYCCPFRASRLEQGRCPRSAPGNLATTTATAATSPPPSSPPTPASGLPDDWPLKELCLVAMAIPVICLLICYCKDRWLYGPRGYRNLFAYMDQEWVPLVGLRRAGATRINDPPPPPLPPCAPEEEEDHRPGQEDDDSPPPSLSEILRQTDKGNREEGTKAKPLVHRNVAGHGSEPGSASEAPSSQ